MSGYVKRRTSHPIYEQALESRLTPLSTMFEGGPDCHRCVN